MFIAQRIAIEDMASEREDNLVKLLLCAATTTHDKCDIFVKLYSYLVKHQSKTEAAKQYCAYLLGRDNVNEDVLADFIADVVSYIKQVEYGVIKIDPCVRAAGLHLYLMFDRFASEPFAEVSKDCPERKSMTQVFEINNDSIDVLMLFYSV